MVLFIFAHEYSEFGNKRIVPVGPIQAATVSQTPTSTPEATATPRNLGEDVETWEIGRSVNEAPLEVIRIGNGPKAVLFVGGIHAGYAPNSVAVAEEAADYFRRVPSAVPPDISLYIIPNLNSDALWEDAYEALFKHPLGCAVGTAVTPTGAVQRFANGLMIWRQDKERVYVLTNDEKLTEHDVNNPDLRGYYNSELHKGAFGYLYNNDPDVRDRLGAPLEAEAPAEDFRLQDFEKGVILTFSNFGGKTTILLTDEARWKAY